MADEISGEYLRDAVAQLHNYKKLGEKAIAQVYDSGLNRSLGPESNSIAVIVKHLRGNMLSRWTMFLTTDGEKPDRDRDAEFEAIEDVSREELIRWWDDGWAAVFEAFKALRAEDLRRTVSIRGQPYSVLQAINRQLMHYSYHIGQMVYLARHLAGPSWKSLSIPKRQSTP